MMWVLMKMYTNCNQSIYIFLFKCYNKNMKNKIKIGIDVDDCICNTLEMDYACAYFMMKNKLPDEIDKNH